MTRVFENAVKFNGFYLLVFNCSLMMMHAVVLMHMLV